MKRLIICLAALCAASPGLAQDKTQLKDQKDKASYSIGYDIGETFKKQNVELNPDALLAGLKDALAGKAPVLSKEERDKVLETFQKEMMEKQVAASKEAAVKNAAEGEKFLADNKKKDGVKTTASGLQYKVLKEGTGPSPKETDTVTTNYKGTLIDGTEFDSSEKHGGPATFRVTGVIKGWTEALQMMKTGSSLPDLRPLQPRLWREGPLPRDRSKFHPGIRTGIAQHRPAGEHSGPTVCARDTGCNRTR